jgi:hypothetical protein
MEITKEFQGADLGDARLNQRLGQVGPALARNPGASFPVAMETEAALEALYRLLNNPRVKPEGILAPHIAQTRARCQEAGPVLVAHDTTEFGFSTQRRGLGRVTDGEEGRGFFQHTALAIAADGSRLPLGVVGALRHIRTGKPKRKRSRHSERQPEPQRESSRWWRLFEAADAQLDGCKAVHVCDREADNYLLMARAVDRNMRFIIRAKHDRHVSAPESPTLRRVTRRLTAILDRKVTVAPRKPTLSWLGSKKKGRTASLEIVAAPVSICRPSTLPSTRKKLPETLELNVVHVREIDPPIGVEPVDWLLLTTEPIETGEQVEAIVDAYDTRWVIEEYFKALKTGCAAEQRQLESAEAIYNAVALLMPIACVLLRLKHHTRITPDAAADTVLPPRELQILEHHPNLKLPSNPTVEQAWLAIARLGGHLKRNGPPGWQVIWRGYLQLLAFVQGAEIAAGLRCDQS